MEYKNIRNITPESMGCAVLMSCPAIYKVETEECILAAGCEYYAIVGPIISPKELKKLGLEEKVGPKEGAVLVDARIIDDRKN